MASSATFRIRSVKCRDEMGGYYREKFGNDEIKGAVFSADLRGSTRNSGRFDIYPDFDDGDVKTFDPPKEVVTLDLAGKTGDVELAFSVLLIESQLTQGDGLESAWNEFVKIYGEALKGELSKREITLEQARAVASHPTYLAPAAGPEPGSLTGVVPADVLSGNASMGTANSGGAGTIAADPDDLMDPSEDEKKKEQVKVSTGDAFMAALLMAIALYTVKYAGDAVGALVGWAQDKFFPPIEVKAVIDASSPPETVPPNATGVAEFRAHDGIYEMEWDILVR